MSRERAPSRMTHDSDLLTCADLGAMPEEFRNELLRILFQLPWLSTPGLEELLHPHLLELIYLHQDRLDCDDVCRQRRLLEYESWRAGHRIHRQRQKMDKSWT